MINEYIPNCLLFGREQAFYSDYKTLRNTISSSIKNQYSSSKNKTPDFEEVKKIWKNDSNGFYFIHQCLLKKEETQEFLEICFSIINILFKSNKGKLFEQCIDFYCLY